jgi:hypothetical protein
VWQSEETSIGVSLGKGYGEGEEEARERVKPVIRRQNTITCVRVFRFVRRSGQVRALNTSHFLHPFQVLVHLNRQ